MSNACAHLEQCEGGETGVLQPEVSGRVSLFYDAPPEFLVLVAQLEDGLFALVGQRPEVRVDDEGPKSVVAMDEDVPPMATWR